MQRMGSAEISQQLRRVVQQQEETGQEPSRPNRFVVMVRGRRSREYIRRRGGAPRRGDLVPERRILSVLAKKRSRLVGPGNETRISKNASRVASLIAFSKLRRNHEIDSSNCECYHLRQLDMLVSKLICFLLLYM